MKDTSNKAAKQVSDLNTCADKLDRWCLKTGLFAESRREVWSGVERMRESAEFITSEAKRIRILRQEKANLLGIISEVRHIYMAIDQETMERTQGYVADQLLAALQTSWSVNE